MKKIIYLIIVVVLISAACGQNNNDKETIQSENESLNLTESNNTETEIINGETGEEAEEEYQSESAKKLAELLSKEDFEFLVKVKESFEQIKTAEDIEQIFNEQTGKTEKILNNKLLYENDPLQEDLPKKWKFIEDFLPFVIVGEGAEGMGVYASYNKYLLSEKATKTPSSEDDEFFKVYNEFYVIDDYDIKQYGMPDFVEWETDVEGYSKLGGGKFLKTLKLIQQSVSKPTCFKKTLLELKLQVLTQIDFFGGFLYSKKEVLEHIDKILNEINLNDAEEKIVNDAKKSIEAKEEDYFNLKQ